MLFFRNRLRRDPPTRAGRFTEVHMVVSERQNLTNLKEFETESSETVKIATVETEEFTTEEVFEKSSDPEEESEELEDGEIEEESSDEPISISIDEPKVEMNGPSKPKEGVAIQYTEVLTCCPPTLRKLTEYLERRWCQRIRARVIT